MTAKSHASHAYVSATRRPTGALTVSRQTRCKHLQLGESQVETDSTPEATAALRDRGWA